jgi:ferredoxin-like protein FixX
MCPNITFYDLKTDSDVEFAYKNAIEKGGIHILAEYPQLYNK